MKLTHTIRALALCALLAVLPGAAPAQELGMTPNHVYAIWDSINDAVLALNEVRDGMGSAATALTEMKPKRFSDLTPADALKLVGAMREKIDVLKKRGDMPLTRVLKGDGTGKVTASVVFLNSGYVLDSLVEWMVSETNRDFLVSRFYNSKKFTGKTVNDVASLAELATRRFAWILENG
jgi:hypothetical protein